MTSKQIGPWLAACVLIADLVLGGATRQGFLSDAILEIASLPLLVFAAYLALSAPIGAQRGWAWAGAAAVMAAPLVQLIPLSPHIWSALPGRDPIVAGFVQADVALPWLPLSVSPDATLRAFFATIPPLAIFLAASVLGTRARLTLAGIIVLVAVFSVVLGLAQVTAGAGSPLRFYEITNAEQAVGFFANRNHFSALLYCALPLLGAAGLWLYRTKQVEMEVAAAVCGAMFIVLLIGIALAASRAGLVLALLACVGVGLMALPRSDRASNVSHSWRWLWALAAFAVVIAMLAVFRGSLPQIDQAVAADARVAIAQSGFAAARAYFPFGSGFGTFVPVYQMFENPAYVTGEYINRAHDDWLEMLIESGALGAALAIGFAIWYALAIRRLRQPTPGAEQNLTSMLASAACWIVGLIALHSLVDYPLRTTALSCVFAFACGCLMPLPDGSEPDFTLLRSRRRKRRPDTRRHGSVSR